MVPNATTLSEIPSPVVLSTLFMHRSTGLAIPGDGVVLCIMKGRDRGRSLPFSSGVYKAAANPGWGRAAPAGS
jgi:hypothetical protein